MLPSNIYPWTNFHELNLEWILGVLKEIETTMTQFVAINSLKYADPIQWNITRQYEKNTIVIDPLTGTAYISVQPVPLGVIITNTDYWSVVFDLQRFVTKANTNFTLRVETQTTLNATFATPVNGWVVWGDTLYRALTNIVAGDQYIENSNIERITVESVTGHPEELTTVIKTNLVAAINELVTTCAALDLKIDTVTGDLSTLVTTDKSNLVAAINEIASQVLGKIGDLSQLLTSDQSNLVAAINEVVGNITALSTQVTAEIGNLTTLKTSSQSSVVDSINSLVDDLTNNTGDLSYLGDKFREPHHRYWIDGANGDDSDTGYDAAHPWKSFAPFLDMLDKGYRDIRCYILSAGIYTLPCSVYESCTLHITGNVSGVVVELANTPGISDATVAFYNSHVNFNNITIRGLGWYIDNGMAVLTDCICETFTALNGGELQGSGNTFYELRISGTFRLENTTLVFDDTRDSIYFLNALGRMSGTVEVQSSANTNTNGYPIHANNAVLFWQTASDTLTGIVDIGVVLNGTIISGTRARINRITNNYGTMQIQNGSARLVDDVYLPNTLYYSGQVYQYNRTVYLPAQVRNNEICAIIPLKCQDHNIPLNLNWTGLYLQYIDIDATPIAYATKNYAVADVSIKCYSQRDHVLIVLTPLNETLTNKNGMLRITGLEISIP